jgi:iron-sulfur cluster repair protein YtfE (RIC family)
MDETRINKHMTINEIMKRYPKTMAVFTRFNVDSCCGGTNTLEKGAEDGGADLQALLSALEEAASLE